MDKETKLREVIRLEFAYDLSMYEDGGNQKVDRVVNKIMDLTTI